MNASTFERLYSQAVQRIRELSAESRALQVVKRKRQESILHLRFEIGRIVDGLMSDRYVDGVKVITWRMLETDTGITQQHLICMRHFYNHPELERDADKMRAWVADLEKASWNAVMTLVTGWKIEPTAEERRERHLVRREQEPQNETPPLPVPDWANQQAPTATLAPDDAGVYECPNCGGEVTKAELRRRPAPPNAPTFDPWERRRRLKRLGPRETA